MSDTPTSYTVTATPFYRASGIRYYADSEGDDVKLGDVFVVKSGEIDEDGDYYGLVERTDNYLHVNASCLSLHVPEEVVEDVAVGPEVVAVDAVLDVLLDFGTPSLIAEAVVAVALRRSK